MSLPCLYYSDDFLSHLTAGHPESPERLKEILKQLEQEQLLKHLPLKEAPEIPMEFLKKYHDPQYLQELQQFCKGAGNGVRIDENTVVSTGSWHAALKAAGASVALADDLLSGKAQTGFCFVRPPGHHAMPNETMGFCLLNNIALAAHHALDVMGLKRVLILDWDAHHGNATEHIFYQDPRVLMVSWHQDPNWPGTGAIEDIGEGAGLGYTLNMPFPFHYGDREFVQSFRELVVPMVHQFKPELILVSAGYDAHHGDILTHMGVTAKGFAQLTEETMKLAHQYCEGRVGFFLEGGYQLQALAHSVSSTVKTLMHEELAFTREPFEAPPEPEDSKLNEIITRIKSIQPLLKGGTI